MSTAISFHPIKHFRFHFTHRFELQFPLFAFRGAFLSTPLETTSRPLTITVYMNEEQNKIESVDVAPSEQRNPRVRLTKTALRIVRKLTALGISDADLVQNSLVLADRTLAFSAPTLADLTGVLMTHRAVVADANLCLLELFELLTDVELLLENNFALRRLNEQVEGAI
jgi:hypothetical protein